MRIIALSDTHSSHKTISNLPEGDVLVHAGDISNTGEAGVLENFARWMKELPHKHKVCIFGNHELTMERSKDQCDYVLKMFEECGIAHLHDSGTEIEGVHFYGSPFTPFFYNWAFNLPRGGKALRAKWRAIPDKTNVLITHGPPYGILDEVPMDILGDGEDGSVENTGCRLLAERVQELPNLKLHIFGHIHTAYGRQELGKTTFINAAMCDPVRRKGLTHAPQIIDI